MGLLSSFATASRLLLSEPADVLTAPVAVAGYEDPSTIISRSRAARVALDLALSIAAVRKAHHVIAGTISTFKFIGWEPDRDDAVDPADPRIAWLQQPDRVEELPWTLSHSITDILWYDRAVWRITDQYITGGIVHADRIHPHRIDTLTDPLDPDRVHKWLIDGHEVPRSKLIVINGGGLGGLQRYGYELLTLYGQLQAAAGRYATAPHPHAILKNSGADLTDEEIDELLDAWEAARTTRSVGYLNDVMDYETVGWTAEELQLTDAREHAALEVARLFGLPALALDAKSGQPLTYANRVDNRAEVLEALRPWIAPMNAALTRVSGVRVELDADAYTRDNPVNRMQMWAGAIEKGILSVDEVRAQEPLAARKARR